MKKKNIFIFLIILVSLFLISRNLDYFQKRYYVHQVIDGDTIRLTDGRIIRYLGIDTPELREKTEEGWAYRPLPYAEEAKKLNEQLVYDKNIKIIKDKEKYDTYNRLLAYVFSDDVFVNYQIIKQGLGVIYLWYPNFKFADLLAHAQRTAIENKKGAWAEEFNPVNLNEIYNYKDNMISVKGRISKIDKTARSFHLKLENKKSLYLTLIVYKNNISLFERNGFSMQDLKTRNIKAYGILKSHNGFLYIVISHPCQIEIIH